MEAIPDFAFQIEKYPEPRQIGAIEYYLTFVRPLDMEPILIRSHFSRSLPAKDFTKFGYSHHIQELYNFLTESGVDGRDAVVLMVQFVELAREVTSSVEYRPHYALLMWLTIDVFPPSEGSFLDESQTEEAIRASLLEYERKSEFRPANKLIVQSLSTRRYKRKRETSSIAEECSVCLEEFKTGQKLTTLPCGHKFDNKCILEWFKINHVCPLCRFELLREDDENFQMTKVY